MIYAVISDIHANKDALAKVIADARAEGAERIVCLGDIVGYGPEPQETLLLLKSEDAIIVAGNHDDAVSGRIQSEDFIDLAHDAVMRHKEALSQESLKYLSTLPYSAKIEGAIITHGDFLAPEKFGYIESEEDAKDNFLAIDSAVAFVGHTHIPEIFLVGQSGTVYKTQPQDFTIEEGKRYIINPGSVGYPRESGGQCHSSYVLYDSTAKTVEFRFLPFAVSSVMQKGIAPRRISKRKIFAITFLMALAAAAEGVSTIYGIERLRGKESDRGEVLREEYAKLGIEIELDYDSNVMRVVGGEPQAHDVDSHDDHRIAMSLAITALRINEPIAIKNRECVAKSYPSFFDDIESLQRGE